MGYTHYFRNYKGMNASQVEDIKKIINTSDVTICGWDGRGEWLVNEKTVRLNGQEGEDHETFGLNRGEGFHFCKTQMKPYDEVVVAILLYLESFKLLTWSSDGCVEDNDFDAGMALLFKAFAGFKIESVVARLKYTKQIGE